MILSAENVVYLSASRAVLSRVAELIDDQHERNPAAAHAADELTDLFAEAQSAKAFISEAAVRIVNRALALSGGDTYLNGSPLSRVWGAGNPVVMPRGCIRGLIRRADLGARHGLVAAS